MSWQSRLDSLALRHHVPGAVLGILREREIETFATGVLNIATGVNVTRQSLFQIGSITKVYTATLALQLADDGKLDIDAPIAAALPELRLAEPHSTALVTMRHLLAHTSGIEGDHFIDVGRGDDVLERYVASCAGLGFSHPVGETMSYCNTGYIIAGRAIEQLTGMTWDAALRSRLLTPLGLDSTVTLPEEVLRFRAAHGHSVDAGQPVRLAPISLLPRSTGPAGLIWASAADVLTFAQAHLDDGAGVLSPASAVLMRTPQVELPDPWTLGRHWGLGWILFDWDGRRVFGHDGTTVGQAAFLRVVPDAGVAVVLLTNGGQAHDLYDELFRELLLELCGLTMPPSLAPPDEPLVLPVSAHAGRYERVGIRFELEERDGTLAGRLISTGPLAELDDPVEELMFVSVAPRVFVTRSDGEQTWTPAVFYELDDGAQYLHMGGRATPKIAEVAR